LEALDISLSLHDVTRCQNDKHIGQVLGFDRPAMKPLRYGVDRPTEQHPMKWGLASQILG
jgi:hypothetical protein